MYGTTTALIISAVVSAAAAATSAVVQSSNANKMAAAQQDAANQQAALQYKEIVRQQEQVNQTAQEQQSDRIRKARQDLGTLRVVAGEQGLSGSSLTSQFMELGYAEGLDLSRIESNRQNNIDSGEASKAAARQGAINTITIAENQASAAKTSAMMGAVGSGLQIATSAWGKMETLNEMKNTKVT